MSTPATKALATTLAHLVPFLSGAGVLVVCAGPHECTPNRMLRLAVEKLGFRIESATCCENGVWPSARDGLNQARSPRSREAMTMDVIGQHVSELSGYAPAMPTPFDNDGNVDSHLMRTVGRFIHGLFLLGSARSGRRAARRASFRFLRWCVFP
jgi:hypothetical protein